MKDQINVDLDSNEAPLMTITKFAETTGVPAGVVRGWCNRGHVRAIKIGKHLLIDVADIRRRK
jgi:excisionase family DNA binding protein